MLSYLEGALAALKIRYEVAGSSELPHSGALVVVANHPYGGIEGLVLLHWLLQRRGNVKVLANEVLASLPTLRPAVIAVDVFGATSATAAAQRNAQAMRSALRHLSGGGVLLVFPAGEVSHLQGGPHGVGPVVADGEWRLGVANLLRRTDASVLPLWVEGRNSGGFQAAGLVHPVLRTLLLPGEMLNKEGRQIQVHSAGIIPATRWAREGDPTGIMTYLRLRAALAARANAVSSVPQAGTSRAESGVAADAATNAVTGAMAIPAVADSEPAQVMAAELAALPASCRLVEAGRFVVYRLQRLQAPAVLLEIGRLRELTFRAVGEGTGATRDLDRHDDYYTHLVLWEAERHEVVGAYRVAAVDEVRMAGGRTALYTTTLFQFREPLAGWLSRAVELGRSFVRAEYQRQHLPLMLLWRAIAVDVLRQPRRHWLFGPASISAQLNPFALAVVLEWLRLHRRQALLSGLVVGRTPPKLVDLPRSLRAELHRCPDVEALDRLVGDIDPRSGGLPPLLRQYLRLGAKCLALNRDAAFEDAVDVLVLVDLDQVPDKLLQRLAGAEAVREFRARREHETFMTRVLRPATKLSHETRIT